MAHINRVICPERELTIFTIEGRVTKKEILQIIDELPAEEQTRHNIWDSKQGSLTEFYGDDLKEIIKFINPGLGTRANGKTAFIARCDMDFGLGRMFQAFANMNGLSVEYRIFKEQESALAWMSEEEASEGSKESEKKGAATLSFPERVVL